MKRDARRVGSSIETRCDPSLADRRDIETAVGIAEAVRGRDVSAREMVERALERIEASNERLNAFVHIAREQALRDADRIDAANGRGEEIGALAGVPFGGKDMDKCAGMPVSYGSLIHKGRPPATQNSVHIERLRAAGAIPVGMTRAGLPVDLQITTRRHRDELAAVGPHLGTDESMAPHGSRLVLGQNIAHKK